MRLLLAFAGLLALTAPAPSAAAPNDKRRGEAWERAHFKAALQLYDRRKFTESLAAFREVLSARGSPNARLYVARSLRELGQLVEAYREMTTTLRDATERAAREPRYVQTRDAAAAERAAIALRIGLLTIALTDRPEHLSVIVNRDEIDPSRIGEALPVEPGPVTVKVWAPGRQSVQKELSISAGVSETLALSLPVAVTVASSAPNAPPDAPPSSSAKTGIVRTAGFVVAGVGVAGVAMFAVAGIMANNKFTELSKVCGNTACPASYKDEVDAGKRLDLVANIGLGIGVAGVAAGALMILLGGPRTRQVTVVPSRSGAWIGYSATF